MQAKQKYPQLAEHAQRIQCGDAPVGAIGTFMHSFLSHKVRYSDVIATAGQHSLLRTLHLAGTQGEGLDLDCCDRAWQQIRTMWVHACCTQFSPDPGWMV